MHWSVFIIDNDMKTSSVNDDDGPNCVSSCALRFQKNFPTNLIWNFRRCFMVSLAPALWQLKSMMFSVFLFNRKESTAARREAVLQFLWTMYPSYLRRKDFDIFWDDRFHHISNIPTISTEYGHCIDWIYCGFWNQLQSSAAIQRYSDTSPDIKTFKLKPFCETENKIR